MISHADLITLAPVQLSDEHYVALGKAYAEPPRVYHTWEHVLDVIGQWLDVDRRLGWHRREVAFLALLYHDAIYVAGRADNEMRSAQFAEEQLRALTAVDAGAVEHLIGLTAAHGKLTPDHVHRDAGLFLDCDMAILGAPPDQYRAYERGIREEYSHLPMSQFQAGRRHFIERLLASHRIFLSDDFHRRLDQQARGNLRAALIAL
jgi:predicted metal-dependent HD superfamily phosphohydrolase